MDRSKLKLLVIDLGLETSRLSQLNTLLRNAGIKLTKTHYRGTPEVSKWISQIRSAITDSDAHILLICCSPALVPTVTELLTAAGTVFQIPVMVAVGDSADPEQLSSVLEAGAAEYLIPPFEADQVLPRLQRLFPQDDICQNDALAWKRRVGLQSLIGESPAFMKALAVLERFAHSNETVLMRGETGSGKELCALALHRLSSRASEPFVPVNCGCIPVELFENEAFGHAQGAYTGANKSFAGFIEQAKRGSLFLDEINSLAPVLQAKLLRFLDEKTYHPLGSEKTCQADLRILAATNADLVSAVRAGTFRADLYHRLSCLHLTLPPLRERGCDIVLLAEHFLSKHAAVQGQSAKRLSISAKRKLLFYPWPGNVRELRNVIDQAATLSRRRVLGATDIDLPAPDTDLVSETFKVAKRKAACKFAVDYLTRVLRQNEGNIAHAAKTAGMGWSAIWHLMQKFDVGPDTNRQQPPS